MDSEIPDSQWQWWCDCKLYHAGLRTRVKRTMYFEHRPYRLGMEIAQELQDPLHSHLGRRQRELDELSPRSSLEQPGTSKRPRAPLPGETRHTLSEFDFDFQSVVENPTMTPEPEYIGQPAHLERQIPLPLPRPRTTARRRLNPVTDVPPPVDDIPRRKVPVEPDRGSVEAERREIERQERERQAAIAAEAAEAEARLQLAQAEELRRMEDEAARREAEREEEEEARLGQGTGGGDADEQDAPPGPGAGGRQPPPDQFGRAGGGPPPPDQPGGAGGAQDGAGYRRGPPPISRVPEVKLTQEFIAALRTASLDNAGYPDDLLERLRNPPTSAPDLSDRALKLSLRIYSATRNSSEQTYTEVCAAIQSVFPELSLLSYSKVRAEAERISGVYAVSDAMCPASCTAFTGPLSGALECSHCHLKNEVRNGKVVPKRTFDTVLPGFVLQALMATPEGADAASYRAQATAAVLPEWNEKGFLDEIGDIPTGSDYLRQEGIGDRDFCLIWSGDGFQLWELKQSDCYVYIWIIVDLHPLTRYKKRYVIPGAFIPGPNKPKNLESFLYPGLYHIAALQNEGLRIWNARLDEVYLSYIWVLFATADTLAIAEVNGLCGHMGKLGCRRYCGLVGRRKPRGKHYYYAIKPPNAAYNTDGATHSYEESLWEDPEDMEVVTARYEENLFKLCSASPEEFERVRRDTGIKKPSIFSGLSRTLPVPACFPTDLMHWAALNLTALFLELWTGKMKHADHDDPEAWAWRILVGAFFEKHGKDVADMLRYLPGSFDRPPRNPFEKLNSGYKAWEYLTWMYGIVPALLEGVLPDKFYRHYCKAVAAIRILHQRTVKHAELIHVVSLLNDVCIGFEDLYCEGRTDRLHFIRHAIHLAKHAAQDATRTGLGMYLSQWVTERSIGIYKVLVRQPSNPYQNLSAQATIVAQLNALYARVPELDPHPTGTLPQSAQKLGGGYILYTARQKWPKAAEPDEAATILQYLDAADVEVAEDWTPTFRRWARLGLPNGQITRCAWSELKQPVDAIRMARNVKISRTPNGEHEFAEVLYYFQLQIDGTWETYALLSMYGKAAPFVYHAEKSQGTVYACVPIPKGHRNRLRVVRPDSIESVVAIPPRVGHGYHFVLEKIGLGGGLLAGEVEEIRDEEDQD